MIAWTTPTLEILVKGGNLLGNNVDVYFTFAQACNSLTVHPDSMTADTDGVLCEVGIGQLQSGGFTAGNAKVQCNVVDSNGYRAASNFERLTIGSNLIPEELAYE